MTETAYFGGGCFWCTEAAFKEVDGVESVTSGYAGGHVEDPTYEEVCSGSTGHAEVVEVEFEPSEVSYGELLELFFRVHDPTQENRQGPDVGSQYRSIVLCTSDEQKEMVRERIETLEEASGDDFKTEVTILEEFYEAEEKHQDFFEKHPSHAYCRMHAAPKQEKAREFDAEREA